jgi:predicted ATP-dependent protease
VNEKVEGFFDACCVQGLSGDQGAIIPAANVGDLMLRHDVVEACARGEFAVYPVDSIGEAIALFFERDAGARRPPHPAGSVLAVAVERARLLYDRAADR